ncbi:MAG TPA: LysR family transcriptional regulator [Pyrinomonadaceae bacterium]
MLSINEMELWQLRTLCVTAETLNFTKAAETLNLTQSAVSHQIKALEEELGTPLFIRASRGVVLTDAGRHAYAHAKRIVAEAEDMLQSVAHRERALVGTVRVAAATQALVYLFAPLFEEFMDSHPSVELIFRTTPTTEQTVNGVVDGSIDIGFASLAVYSPALAVTPLFEDELTLVVGKNHEFAKRGVVSIDDIRLERWILFERGASIRRATDTFFKDAGMVPEKALESNDTYFIKIMIERGLGIALMPVWAVREEVASGELAQLAIEGHRLRRSVAMVALKGSKSAAIDAFIGFMSDNKDVLHAQANK